MGDYERLLLDARLALELFTRPEIRKTIRDSETIQPHDA